MNDLLKLIDLEADTPIEREFVKLLFRYKIQFDAQPHLLVPMVAYSVKDAKDLPLAKQLLYRALHPREAGAIR
jgi:hypothetical protein